MRSAISIPLARASLGDSGGYPTGTNLYRARTPEWTSCPTSDAGATRKDDRFNREGVEATLLQSYRCGHD